MDRLKGDAVDLSEVLDPDQPRRGNGNPPLFDEVATIGQTHSDARFPWATWDPRLELRLRSWDQDKYGDFILTHDALYLRYPFPEDIPSAPGAVLLEGGIPDEAADFYSAAFMTVIDKLVMTDYGRMLFSSDGTVGGLPPSDNDAEIKIRAVLAIMDKTVGVPPDPGLNVHVEGGWGTYKTKWERYDDYFYLRLGWVRDAMRDLLIPDWPCGALS